MALDFSGITVDIEAGVASAVLALIALSGLLMVVAYARWAYDQVCYWFEWGIYDPNNRDNYW